MPVSNVTEVNHKTYLASEIIISVPQSLLNIYHLQEVLCLLYEIGTEDSNIATIYAAQITEVM